ncbi:MAG: hypothetical protein ACI7YS_02555 [Flavobacterium sp.]
MWNCALKSFNAENCGSTLLIGDENNLGELADISVNLLKLYTEDPANPENMGMLVMLNGFNSCLSHNYDLEKVSFAMANDSAYTQLVNKIQNFNNFPFDQPRINELVSKDTLSITDLDDLAKALSFSGTQDMNNFQCQIQNDIINLRNNHIDQNLTYDDNISIFGSAKRYSKLGLGLNDNMMPNYFILSSLTPNCAMMPSFPDTTTYGYCEGIRVHQDAIARNWMLAELGGCAGAGFGTFSYITGSTLGLGAVAGAIGGVIVGGGCGAIVVNTYYHQLGLNQLQYNDCKRTH